MQDLKANNAEDGYLAGLEKKIRAVESAPSSMNSGWRLLW